jgi:hypothetical protein
LSCCIAEKSSVNDSGVRFALLPDDVLFELLLLFEDDDLDEDPHAANVMIATANKIPRGDAIRMISLSDEPAYVFYDAPLGAMRVPARWLQAQDPRAGLDPLAFAHGDLDDALGRGRRQRDAVVFQRAQRLRHVLAAGGHQQRGSEYAGGQRRAGRFEDSHSGSSRPRRTSATA